MTLGERIEKARQEKQLSQKELATELGKNTVDIALWESNEAVPSISDLTKISSALDVSVDSLVNNVDINEERIGNHIEPKSDVDNSRVTIEPQPKLTKYN